MPMSSLLLTGQLQLDLAAACRLRPSEIGRDLRNQPAGMCSKSISGRRVIEGGTSLRVQRNVPDAGRSGLNTSRVGESILAMDG